MEVYLSPLAEKKLQELLNYLQDRWSLRVRNKFLNKILASISLIRSYPESCQVIRDFPNVRKCVVSKEASFYYRIHANAIEIITIIDNRQDPNRIFEDSDF